MDSHFTRALQMTTKKKEVQTKRKKKEKKKSEAMIDEDDLGRSLDAKIPPFFGLSSPTPFSLFLPPDQIGTSNCLIPSVLFWISRILGASVPFSLFLTTLPHPESLRLPGFSRLHSFSPPCIIILEAFLLFASSSSCLSTLS